MKAGSNKHNKYKKAVKRDGCNCLTSRKDECNLPGWCATRSVVYKATVWRPDRNTVNCYRGLTGDRFIDRYNQHLPDIILGENRKSKFKWVLNKAQQHRR